MKALSIRQPWAWLIAHGHKDIENRKWKTKFRGTFAIHTGKAVDMCAIDSPPDAIYSRGLGLEFELANMPVGGIVGVAQITTCVGHSDSEWFDGPWGFEIVNARPIEFIPCPGRLGFFELPAAIAGQIEGLTE